MKASAWQLAHSLDAILFDCDSTLSAVEGITVLAEFNGVFQQVHDLTEEAMAKTGINSEMYHQRLALVKPRAAQIQDVIDAYWQALTPGMDKVIDCLHALGKSVYVVSAGLKPAVVGFAAKLHIPAEHVFAVDVYFDSAGHYQDFDRHSSLTTQFGKGNVVMELQKTHRCIAHVGDGMNDVEVAKMVNRFIGYGGSCYRQSIAELSPFYIRRPSMLPLLPLVLSAEEIERLPQHARMLYNAGLEYIEQGAVEFRDDPSLACGETE